LINHKLNKYINNKLANKKWSANKTPDKTPYDFLITIPCYDEYDYIFKTLDSINSQNKNILKNTLVSVAINNSIDEDKSIIVNNQRTYQKLLNNKYDFELIIIDAFSKNKSLESKISGAGMARKISVDLMISYLKSNSIICFIDADTILSEKYLSIIKSSYNKHNWNAATVNFLHQSDELKTKKLIREYEKFLKVTSSNIKECGSPYSYVSLGSTMICTCSAYVSVGGMNKRAAGEDFYFLQELEKFCGVKQINDILVHPSSRYLSRLYMGTSMRLQKSLNGELNLSTLYFSESSFKILKKWIKLALSSDKKDYNALIKDINKIDSKLLPFLYKINFKKAWDSITLAPSYNHFSKQFHRWFDALSVFKLLKFYTKS